MKTIQFFLLLTAYCLLPTSSIAQYTRYTEYGLWGGSATYFGDLNINNSFIYTRPAGGLIFRKNFTNLHFAFKGGLNVGLLKFSDTNKYPYQKVRNLSFSTIVVELSSQIEFNFFKFRIDKLQHRFIPYLFAGAGVFYFNYKDTYERQYSPVQPVILYGFGIKSNINRFWNLTISAGNRKTFTDYIDGVSTIYRNNINPFGIDKKQRGDSQRNDSYLFLAVSVTRIIRNFKCPNSID